MPIHANAHPRAGLAACVVLAAAATAGAQSYTLVKLGIPAGADSVVGTRMNNLGEVVGWSQYFGQGEPSLKGWVWRPQTGFEILPPPPGFFDGRSRASVINDAGVIGGDGGGDIDLAWRYQNGQYEITGGVGGLPKAVASGINAHGDLVGFAADAQIITPDLAFLSVSGGALLNLMPSGARAVDVNDLGQVCGYSHGPASPSTGWVREPGGTFSPLGDLGLGRSFPTRMNNLGQVVGYAQSASGNTVRAWIHSAATGTVAIPGVQPNASWCVGINDQGHVIGMTSQSGPDFNWLWTGGPGVTDIATFISPGANLNLLDVVDINEQGQILARVFDNGIVDFQMIILTPESACYPDCNADGALNLADFGCFQTKFALADPWADCNGDGALNLADFGCFQTRFAVGCP